MTAVQSGDIVRVDYVGMLDDGTVFDSTVGKAPLQFIVGGGQVIAGFEEAVVGMSPGEEKTCRIPMDKAFGEPRKEMEVAIRRDQLPENDSLGVGDLVEIRPDSGPAVSGRVTSISESTFTLDLNHPLAGQDVTFALRLVEIVESVQ
jgi:peptidylprolyl isomerase